MRIQHNIAALNSYRNLTGNNNAVSKNLEKLSSGYRINRAGDDAAGLAISEKMRAQITGLETAQKNANDGISLVQTAEGALTEVHSMLNRMVELADQSANGTYDNETDRANLQKEVQSLKDEIDRISEGTNFNGINLLDGSLEGGSNGANGIVGGVIANFKPASTAAITGIDASGAGAIDYTKKDVITVDGVNIEVDWSTLTADEKSALEIDWTSNTSDAVSKKAASIVENKINESISKTNAQNGTNVANVKVEAQTGGKTFKITSGMENNGASEIVVTGDPATDKSVLGSFGAQDASATKASATHTLKITPTDGNGKFNMTLNGESIEIDLTTLAAGDTGTNIATKLNTAIQTALGNYDTAKGTTGTDDAVAGKISVSFNKSGQLEINNSTDIKIGFEDKDGGSAAKTLGISAQGKAIYGGGLTLQIGDTSADFNQLTVSVSAMDSNSLGIAGVDISTQSGAKAAVDLIKSAIDKVSSTRGDLGAIQNRLEHTINNLSVTTENMTAAESRIRDVDMADEMMAYTKNNILVQASQAMLAQANQVPQGVLQLLQ
nr:flagellin [uncultured Eisenbergiella sp.]